DADLSPPAKLRGTRPRRSRGRRRLRRALPTARRECEQHERGAEHDETRMHAAILTSCRARRCTNGARTTVSFRASATRVCWLYTRGTAQPCGLRLFVYTPATGRFFVHAMQLYKEKLSCDFTCELH